MTVAPDAVSVRNKLNFNTGLTNRFYASYGSGPYINFDTGTYIQFGPNAMYSFFIGGRCVATLDGNGNLDLKGSVTQNGTPSP